MGLINACPVFKCANTREFPSRMIRGTPSLLLRVASLLFTVLLLWQLHWTKETEDFLKDKGRDGPRAMLERQVRP
jgi:hypothetical protein